MSRIYRIYVLCIFINFKTIIYHVTCFVPQKVGESRRKDVKHLVSKKTGSSRIKVRIMNFVMEVMACDVIMLNEKKNDF